MISRRPKKQSVEAAPYPISEELYQALFEQATDGIFIADRQGHYIEVNPRGCEMLGYTREEILNLSIENLIPAEDLLTDPLRLDELRAGKTVLKERRLRCKDGRLLPVEIGGRMLADGSFLGIVRDISERKQAEEAVRRAYQDYATLVNSVDGIVWEADAQTFQFSFASQQAERLLGYPVERWLTEPTFWKDHIHPDDREWAVDYCIKSTQAKRPHEFEYRMVAADGRVVWLQDIVTVVVENDHPMRLQGLMVDITERKQAEKEREAHLWFLESLDQVNRAIQGTNDLEQMMRDVLEAVLAIFACDRAWLVYPCDPAAASWSVPMECTRPEYPGAFALGLEAPMDPEVAAVAQTLRDSSDPVKFGPESEHRVPAGVAQGFSVQSFIAMALYPKIDKPYMFGLHQCSYPRVWTPQEERLLQEVGRRLADALTSLLVYRNLRESERRLAEAERMAHVGWWDRDYDANRITLSDEACRIFGLPLEERRRDLAQWHKRWKELIHPEDRPKAAQAAEEALRGGPRYDVEYRVVRPNGEVRFVRSQGNVTWDESGRPRRMFGIMQDITELRQAEQELRASEARFRTFVDHATDAFFLHDDQGNILDVNRQACESLGYSREELIGLSPLEFDVDVDHSFIEQLQARLAAGERMAFDTRHRRKDGSVFPVEVRTRSFWQGERRFGVSLVRDITERKQAQEALTLFRSLLDHANDMIEVVDPETGRFLDVNEQACLVHGYTRQEYLALTVSDINPIVAAGAWQKALGDLRQSGSRISESQHRRKDGSLFPVEVNISYIRLDRDYVLAVVRDITERKRAEEELRRHREHLEEMVAERTAQLAAANKELEAFAYSVSHDLRAPLRHIDGFLELLQKRAAGALDERSQHYMDTISDSARRMGKLIDDLLTFSRMGRYEMSKMPVDLGDLAQEIIQEFTPETQGRSIHWRIAELPTVTGDRAMLRLALVNLISNALKFTQQRRPAEIEIGCLPGQDSETVIFIRDNGVGFDMAYAGKLFGVFQRFHRVDEFEGTGIGLANVRRIIARHGGRTWAEGKVNQGATFYFSLPQSIQEA